MAEVAPPTPAELLREARFAVEAFLKNGWKFRYEPETHFIGAYHTEGGSLSICSISVPGNATRDAFGRFLENALSQREEDEDRMVKISALIKQLQETHERFGDTCVYIRRGGMAWGALALNRRDDDQKHGVFDLQAQHDRDMQHMLEWVQRLQKSKRELEERLAALSPTEPGTNSDTSGKDFIYRASGDQRTEPGEAE